MPAGGYAPTYAPPNDSQATTALVLGILSVVCCSILGPVAIFIGNASRRRIQASGGTLGGSGLATAGFVLGIIGTVFLVIGVYVLAALAAGAARFWRDTGATLHQVMSPSAFLRATGDVFGLRYLGAQGVGCTYPAAGFSQQRRWLHHLVFYGFLLDLASTTLAAITDHVLGVPAPYPLYHPVVVLGTVGGVALSIGCAGLLWLKSQSDRSASVERMQRMDVAFLVMLLLTGLTGLLLLALRDTSAMGSLLVVHLGVVAGLFLTMPYGKFAHAVYRYAALVRNAVESEREQAHG